MNIFFAILIKTFMVKGLFGNDALFKSYRNKDFSYINPFDYYISVKMNNLIECLSLCARDDQCILAHYKFFMCSLFRSIKSRYIIDSNQNYLYQRLNNRYYELNVGLQNYWSFSNNVNDSVGLSDLYNGVNSTFISDRFGNPNSSLDLRHGYYTVPQGRYFNGPFTVSAWIYIRSNQAYFKVLDFGVPKICTPPCGVDPGMDISFDSNLCPYIGMTDTSISFSNKSTSSKPIILNTWTHLCATHDGIEFKLYMNGTIVARFSSSFPSNATRTSNFIGKSNWSSNDKTPDGIYDEIRIYNRVLNENEIYDLINFKY